MATNNTTAVESRRALSIPKVARIFGVDEDTVRKLIDNGRLAAVDLTVPGARYRTIRVWSDAIERYIRDNPAHLKVLDGGKR